MNEKMFNLLEKMYVEFHDMKSNIATKDDLSRMATKDDLNGMATKDDLSKVERGLKSDIARLEIGIQQNHYHIIRLENEMQQNHKVLFDGYRQIHDKLEIFDRKFDKVMND